MSAIPQLDQFDFHPRLMATPGVSLVMFSSPDCGACRHLSTVLLDLGRRCPDWQTFKVDAQRDPALAHEFEIFHLPTLFLFNDGEFHCELAAPAQVDAIIAAIEAALRQPAQEAP